jgi:hypothetical protein
MKSIARVDTTLNGISRCTTATMLLVCSIAACADPPNSADDVATSGQSIQSTWDQWKSVRGGVASLQSSVAEISIGGGNQTLFVVDTNNGIATTTGNPSTGWGNWTPVGPSGVVRSHTSVAALPIGNGKSGLFIVGADAAVNDSIDVQSPQSRWFLVPGKTANSDTSVTAVGSSNGQFTLFIVGADGLVYTSTGPIPGLDPTWTDWAAVTIPPPKPGTSVAAVPTGNGMFAVFDIGADGRIYPAIGSGREWISYPAVGTGVAHANAPKVTTIADTSGNFTLWVVGTDGIVHTSSGSPQTGWTPWPPVGTRTARPDAPVTAVKTVDGHFALFIAGADDTVYTTAGSVQNEWTRVAGLSVGLRTSVTADRVGAIYYLQATDQSGKIFSTFGPH